MGRPAVASASFATASPAAPAGAVANPYSVAEPVSPYAPPRAVLHDAGDYVGDGEVVYAGFWKRLAAVVIDSFVVGIIGGIVQMLLMGMFFGVGVGLGGDPASLFASGGSIALLALVYLIPLGLQAVYFAMFHAGGSQATLGKMAVGIKVTDDDGRRISFARGIGRYFATIPSALILFIGYVMAAFTDRKRALHDMLAGTLVVDRWAFTAHPERQRTELGTVTIVILVIGGLLILAYLALIMLAVGLAAAAGARRALRKAEQNATGGRPEPRPASRCAPA